MKVYELMNELSKLEAGSEVQINIVVSQDEIVDNGDGYVSIFDSLTDVDTSIGRTVVLQN